MVLVSEVRFRPTTHDVECFDEHEHAMGAECVETLGRPHHPTRPQVWAEAGNAGARQRDYSRSNVWLYAAIARDSGNDLLPEGSIARPCHEDSRIKPILLAVIIAVECQLVSNFNFEMLDVGFYNLK